MATTPWEVDDIGTQEADTPWKVDDTAESAATPWKVDDTVKPSPTKTSRVSAAPSAPANPPVNTQPTPMRITVRPTKPAQVPWKEDDTIVSTPQDTRRDFTTRVGDAWKAGIQGDNFVGRMALFLADKANVAKDEVRRAYPNQSEEFYEVSHRSLLEQAQRQIREDYEAKQAADPAWRPDESWIRNLTSGRIFADILGALPAEAGPEMLLNPGKTVLGRIGAQMGLSGLADLGYQGIAMEQGVRDEYSPLQTAWSAGLGGGFQGVLEAGRGVAKGIDILRGKDNVEDPLVRPTPGRRMTDAQAAQYVEALKTGTADEVEQLLKDFGGFTTNRQDLDNFIAARDRPDAKPARLIYEDQKQELLQPGTPSQRAAGKFVPQTKAIPSVNYARFTVQDATDRVNTITEGWENKPEFEIVEDINKIADPKVRRAVKAEMGKGNGKNVMGFLGEDGKVRIISGNVRSEDELSAVLFHETLGHAGLKARFQDTLDDVLMTFYNSGSGNFKATVDAWADKNPNKYKNDPNRLARAAEEVLAEMSQGGRIEPGLWAQIVERIKRFAREHGMNLKYTDKEIRTILGLAHADITGAGRSSDFKGGTRLITTWHGTRADEFDNVSDTAPFGKFDLNRAGEGTGAAAFGHGVYVADIKSVAEGYAGRYQATDKDGSVFEVELPDDAKWLDWDKPLKNQPEVQFALEKAGLKKLSVEEYDALVKEADQARKEYTQARSNRWSMSTEKYAEIQQKAAEAGRKQFSAFTDELTGEKAYERLRLMFDRMGGEASTYSDKFASDALNRFGISGNRYKNVDKRGREGFNYVVFDDNVPKITNKFMTREEGDDTRIGNINTANIKTVGDIDNILELLAAKNPNETKTVEEINYEARQLGFTPSKVAKQPGVGNLSARITAARQVMTDLLDQVAKLDDDPRSSNAAYVKRMQLYSKLAAVHAKVSGDINELGRAMRSLQILSESQRSADEIARRMQDGGNDIFKDPELFAQFDADIRAMMRDGNRRGALLKTKESFKPKAEDYIFAGWYNFLLSSPATHFVNVVGTGLNFTNDLLTRGLAATLGQGKRFSPNADRVMGREVVARVWGAIQAMKDATTYQKTLEAYKRGTSESFDNTKAENQTIVIQNKPTSYVLESPVRALASEDEWFRNVIQLSNIYGMAVRKAGKEGLKGKAFRDRVNDLIDAPTRDMIENSKEFSKVMQFQDEMSGIGKMVNNLRKTNPKDDKLTRIAKGTMRLIVPFLQTPDALIRTAVRNMGPFAVLEREFWKGVKKGGPEEDIIKARMLASSALMTFFAVQVANGGIAGNGPSDPKKREEWLLTNQPNSIKVNGKWYSIAGLDPFVSPILAVATAYERAQYGEESEEGYMSTAIDATLGMARAMADTAYTQNLVEAMAMFDADDEKATDKFNNWAAGIAASATVPSILRQYAQNYGDQNEYVTKGDGSLSDRISGRIVAGVKGTAVEQTLKDMGVNTDLPQKYDPLGRPKVRGETYGPDMLTRIRTRDEETDPVVLELSRLGKAMKGPLVTYPGKVVGKRTLTEEEYAEYTRLSGEYIREKVREVMETSRWQNASDIERRKMVVKIKTKQRKNAKEDLGLNKTQSTEEEE